MLYKFLIKKYIFSEIARISFLGDGGSSWNLHFEMYLRHVGNRNCDDCEMYTFRENMHQNINDPSQGYYNNCKLIRIYVLKLLILILKSYDQKNCETVNVLTYQKKINMINFQRKICFSFSR